MSRMAKRHRTRTRSRRGIEAARRASTPERAEREEAPASRPAHRPSRSGRLGYARAVGAPSPSLERAAVMERGFIFKDFRRLGLVVGVGLIVLLIAGVLEGMLVK